MLAAQIGAIRWDLAGLCRFTQEQEDVLRQPVNPDLVEIKYEGTVYMPGAYYRKVLNDAFGPGGWSLVETGPVKLIDGTYYLSAVLVCEGRPVATAIGEYQPGGHNPKVSPGMAKESCRTDAISKSCKTLGVAEELWFPAFCRKWQADHAVQARSKRTDRLEWRRKDDMAGAEAFKPGYTGESEYTRPARVQDENQAHIDAIQREDDYPRTRNLAVYPHYVGEDEQARYLAETLEGGPDADFSDDSR